MQNVTTGMRWRIALQRAPRGVAERHAVVRRISPALGGTTIQPAAVRLRALALVRRLGSSPSGGTGHGSDDGGGCCDGHRRCPSLAATPALSSSNDPGTATIRTAIEQAANLLPDQGILTNFVHHNPLHRFESLPFGDAVAHVERMSASTSSPGERACRLVKGGFDPRERVNEAIVDLSGAFLDLGVAKWSPSFRDRGFLYFFATLEPLGFAAWRGPARAAAQQMLAQALGPSAETNSASTPRSALPTANVVVPRDGLCASAEAVLQENLEYFGVAPQDWESVIRSMLLEIPGWAGMFSRMERHPAEAPPGAVVRLADFCAVKSTLLRSSVMSAAKQHGHWDPSRQSLADWLAQAPRGCGTDGLARRSPHPSALASTAHTARNSESLEHEFATQLLQRIGTGPVPERTTRPELQLYACIDDRACSLRRHLEKLGNYETFGVAGFFGLPIRYQAVGSQEQVVLAPEGVVPRVTMVEADSAAGKKAAAQRRRRLRLLSRAGLSWERLSFSPAGSIVLSLFGPVSLTRLWLMAVSPQWYHAAKDWMLGLVLPAVPEPDFELPFTPGQAAELLALTFQDIGTSARFAPLVLVLGHGASSQNNPFEAAYNCGACSGRQGGPNARLLARAANNREVRAALATNHDVHVPDDTVFVGAMHNTTTDTVHYYDSDAVPTTHAESFAQARSALAKACGDNAVERCRRFLLAQSVGTPKEALAHVRERALDVAEVRPELNHATNAAVVVGRRELTVGRSFDRRAFLPSYDPRNDDDAGTRLEHVLSPALTVTSGINLEYYFATVDPLYYGAGTKCPVNVVGLLGILQGSTGDLRTGLPTQMTEMHAPLRETFVVDAPVHRVKQVLARRQDLRQLVVNDWVHLFVRDPDSGQFFRQQGGEYLPVEVPALPGTAQAQGRAVSNGTLRERQVVRNEQMMHWAAAAAMVASCVVPVLYYGQAALNPYGTAIAVGGTAVALPVLSFSRRYMHGEHMFGRFAALSTGVVLGFNLVATAPTLHHMLGAWSLLGFVSVAAARPAASPTVCIARQWPVVRALASAVAHSIINCPVRFSSAFLIGAYNDRPTVRRNATAAVAVYQVSDLALLTAAAFGAHAVTDNAEVTAAALAVAALLKSSQFPLTALLQRSMEGPTPTSALGYAGLSAHAGIVLLTSTMDLWYPVEWVRVALAAVGLTTAAYGTLAAKTRPDRKGAVGNITAAAIGPMFIALSLGYADAALAMALGHASFRVVQVLRSPSLISDDTARRNMLGSATDPVVVPDALYRLAWRLRRIDTDAFNALLDKLDWRWPAVERSLKDLSKVQQWLLTGSGVVVAGFPYTPLSDGIEHTLCELLPQHPAVAGSLMATKMAFSVFVVRGIFYHVLCPNRFSRTGGTSDAARDQDATKRSR